uniref:Uncharacterized protein n=1 Tax=Oryza glumipatula TaxID=40148 RepID=A0A0D9Z4X2_9ORYZ
MLDDDSRHAEAHLRCPQFREIAVAVEVLHNLTHARPCTSQWMRAKQAKLEHKLNLLLGIAISEPWINFEHPIDKHHRSFLLNRPTPTCNLEKECAKCEYICIWCSFGAVSKLRS